MAVSFLLFFNKRGQH